MEIVKLEAEENIGDGEVVEAARVRGGLERQRWGWRGGNKEGENSLGSIGEEEGSEGKSCISSRAGPNGFVLGSSLGLHRARDWVCSKSSGLSHARSLKIIFGPSLGRGRARPSPAKFHL